MTSATLLARNAADNHARRTHVEHIPAPRVTQSNRNRPRGYVAPAASGNPAVFVGLQVTECSTQEVAERTLNALRNIGICR